MFNAKGQGSMMVAFMLLKLPQISPELYMNMI